MGSSAQMIVELNIKHFRNLLKTEADPQKRATIRMLLAEEEAKLVKLSEQERKN